MKKLILFTLVLFIAVSCKKMTKDPEGPTDVRIKNLTTVNMTDLTVSTGGGEHNFGLLKADSITVYHRFDKSYPKANISAMINGQKYKTDTVTYGWMQYMGQMKVTYKIYILKDAQKKLAISDVVPEGPLK
jgi:hypothetical protein